MSVTAELDLHPPCAAQGRRILVVRRPNDSFDRTPYTIHVLMEQWREWGFTVEVSDRMNAEAGSDTIVVPHIDVTRIPPEYQTGLQRSAIVVNRAVTDISKRKISANLITTPADHDGPVIVKTNLNFGGYPEFERFNDKGRVAQAALVLARCLPWTLTGMLRKYEVFEHPSLVPRAVWRNPLLVVEKFLPEQQDGMYCLRQYTFFGSSEINTIAFSTNPIVKAANVTRRVVLPEPPPGVREIRSALGFDFGKFDYVLQEGRVVLFDANRTPTYNPASKLGPIRPLLISLARGIGAFCG